MRRILKDVTFDDVIDLSKDEVINLSETPKVTEEVFDLTHTTEFLAVPKRALGNKIIVLSDDEKLHKEIEASAASTSRWEVQNSIDDATQSSSSKIVFAIPNHFFSFYFFFFFQELTILMTSTRRSILFIVLKTFNTLSISITANLLAAPSKFRSFQSSIKQQMKN